MFTHTTRRVVATLALLASIAFTAPACALLQKSAPQTAESSRAEVQRVALATAESADRMAFAIEELQKVEILAFEAGLVPAPAHVAIQREFLFLAETLRPGLADLKDASTSPTLRAAYLRFALKQIDRLASSKAVSDLTSSVRGEVRALIVGLQMTASMALVQVGG